MTKIVAAHVVFIIVERKQQFLVTGDVRVAQKCAAFIVPIDCLWCIEGSFREMVGHGGVEIEIISLAAFRLRINQQNKEVQQISGQIANVPVHDQTAFSVLLINLLSLVIKDFCKSRLIDQKHVFLQRRCHVFHRGLFSHAEENLLQMLEEIVDAELGISTEIIVSQLCLFGEPVSRVIGRTVRPAGGKIRRTEFLCLNGNGSQKLIIQLCGGFRFFAAHLRDIQRMVVLPESAPIVLPGHTVLFQPAIAFEHALGQNDLHIINCVNVAPNIGDGFCAAVFQKVFEVHLMQHTFHKRQSDLERGVDVFTTEPFVDGFSILCGDQTLAVKAGDVDVRAFFHSFIFAGAVLGAVIFDRNDIDVIHGTHKIVDDDHTAGYINTDILHTDTGGHHQSVVGVEFTELALTDVHTKHNAAAHTLIQIRANEREPSVAAHVAGAFKSNIAVGCAADGQSDTFRTEHISGLRLAQNLSAAVAAHIEDAGEVHIDDRIVQFRGCVF